jgi:glycine cleavage system protein P-like pyridoxal-binding family
MLAIAREAAERPEALRDAPHARPVKRLDEVRAAKRAIVKYGFERHDDATAAEPGHRQLEAQKGA